MQKLSFKQYLNSKEQLLKAIQNTPTSIIEYEVKKYCSLTVGDSEEDKSIIGLKPKHKIIIEWRYDNLLDPTPETIQFVGTKEIDQDEKMTTFWSGAKLTKWLARHTHRGENNGHNI